MESARAVKGLCVAWWTTYVANCTSYAIGSWPRSIASGPQRRQSALTTAVIARSSPLRSWRTCQRSSSGRHPRHGFGPPQDIAVLDTTHPLSRCCLDDALPIHRPHRHDAPATAAGVKAGASFPSFIHWRPSCSPPHHTQTCHVLSTSSVNGNRKLHASGEDVSGGADVLPLMPIGRVGLDAGSGATGVLANTRRETSGPAVTGRLPHPAVPTRPAASADAPASGSCCPGC